jgi:hypothetical protein
VGHPAEHLHAGRGSAGYHGGAAKEFPTRDRSGVELFGKAMDTLIRAVFYAHVSFLPHLTKPRSSLTAAIGCWAIYSRHHGKASFPRSGCFEALLQYGMRVP